jgi:arylsulfatase A-like enzyme
VEWTLQNERMSVWRSRLVLFLAALGPLSSLDAQESVDRPPNVVFLLVDDLGWADVSPNNPGTFYDTPNVARLAAEGMNLTQAYAACPVCSPTRASLMTGQNPARLDTTQYFGGTQPQGAKARPNWKRPLYPAPYLNRLPAEARTLAEALGDRGFTNWFGGKWHLGDQGSWPEDHGFDINVGGHRAGHPPKGYFAPWGIPNLSDDADGTYLTTRLTDEAVSFLDGRADAEEPFLLYLAYYQVHTPLQGREDLVAKYQAKKAAMAIEEPIFGKEHLNRVRLVQEHAVYAAMVEAMDESVGRVLEALDRNGLADDTVVVFFSDNGGLSTSEGLPTSNLPLRAGKGWLYEGGVREPCIVRWPGRVEAGSESDFPVQSVDFYPTLCEITGADAGDDRVLDGVSLKGLLTGAEAPDRDTLYWHYPHYSNQGGGPAGAIRVGPHKLIEDFETGGIELYDVVADIGEQRDLAAEQPELAAMLLRQLRSWRSGIGARMPTRVPGR